MLLSGISRFPEVDRILTYIILQIETYYPNYMSCVVGALPPREFDAIANADQIGSLLVFFIMARRARLRIGPCSGGPDPI
jgi:hypothetical protein